jgi:hypothetical protein
MRLGSPSLPPKEKVCAAGRIRTDRYEAVALPAELPRWVGARNFHVRYSDPNRSQTWPQTRPRFGSSVPYIVSVLAPLAHMKIYFAPAANLRANVSRPKETVHVHGSHQSTRLREEDCPRRGAGPCRRLAAQFVGLGRRGGRVGAARYRTLPLAIDRLTLASASYWQLLRAPMTPSCTAWGFSKVLNTCPVLFNFEQGYSFLRNDLELMGRVH